MANEITVSISLRWTKNNQSVSGSVSDSFDQVGNAAIGVVQTIAGTTEQIDFAEIAGTKYMMLRNMATKGSAEILYVDKVTPVVPASAPIKLIAGAGSFQITPDDTLYAICEGGTATADLGIVAVEA